MWYYFYMNKDVIYIEPEDDITDIINKIENSKEKIVALVPPKKAGVFRSVVNIKLISKVGKTAEKTIVLVTTDPSIVKLAATTRIPVTKNLQTPPAIPSADVEIETVSEEIVSGPEELIEEEIDNAQKSEKAADDKEEDTEDESSEEDEEEKSKDKSKKADKKSKSDKNKTGNPVLDWIKTHKKLAIFGGIGIVVLILVLVWAFVIAPAVTVTVGISTDSMNFAETVTFTTNMAEENAKEGKFFLQEKKLETVSEVEFAATGQKNLGEKAKGSVVVYVYFNAKGTYAINAGTAFTINDLSYLANANTSLKWDGNKKSCENKDSEEDPVISDGVVRCLISERVEVTAAQAGAKYNIAKSSAGWSTVANLAVYSDEAMSGGTDNIVTVVEQSDIEKAKNELKASNEEENKAKLLENDGGDMLIIESSFTQDTSAAVATPAAGEEVKDGQKPVLKATTVATAFAVDKAKLEEFITEKAKLGDDQKIYEIKDPYIENFVKGDTGYAGKLKTSYAVGPKVTENDILEMIKGKGIGDAQHDLKNINGVTSVNVDKSYPWVSVIPGDTNKITINIEVKEN